jgi:hypothetical protein
MCRISRIHDRGAGVGIHVNMVNIKRCKQGKYGVWSSPWEWMDRPKDVQMHIIGKRLKRLLLRKKIYNKI